MRDVLPASLLNSDRAVLWNYEVRPGDPKPTKVPFQAHRPTQRAAVDNPATWAAMPVAIDAFDAGQSDGVGIVLGDGLVGVDLDACRNPDTGELTSAARDIITRLASYSEVSPSGTGVHILVRGVLPAGGRRRGRIEMYAALRYFTLTGRHIAGTPQTIEERSDALARLHAELFPAPVAQPRPTRPTARLDLDDRTLIERASAARNGATFSSLWAGERGPYGDDHSAADLALANLLAFWTGANARRMDRLFRQSALFRDKWDERRGAQTYGELTLARAIADCRDVYTPSREPQISKSAHGPTLPPSWTTPPAERRSIHLTAASSIVVRPVKWLWNLRLALGTLGLLGGREGIGKSIVAYTIGAMLTKGRLPGIYFGTPKAVIVAATEDSWAHTICPRLMAAGADLSRVFRVDVITAEGGEGTLSLPRDLAELEQAIGQIDAAMLVLDPLLSRLDAGLDSHKDAECRVALEPLVKLTEKTGCFTLGLIHVNKSTSGDALTTLMASRAFAAVARSVLYAMVDPDNEQTRLLGQIKNNLGRADLPTLAFHIVGEKVADTPEGEVWTGRLDWLGETDRSIKEAMVSAAEMAGDKSATTEAAEWLADYLHSQDGSADSATIKREGGKAGHNVDALKRARRKLQIAAVNQGFPRKTFWTLTPQSEQPPVGAACGETALTTLTAPTGEFVRKFTPPVGAPSVQSEQSEQSERVSRLGALTAPPQQPEASRDRF